MREQQSDFNIFNIFNIFHIYNMLGPNAQTILLFSSALEVLASTFTEKVSSSNESQHNFSTDQTGQHTTTSDDFFNSLATIVLCPIVIFNMFTSVLTGTFMGSMMTNSFFSDKPDSTPKNECGTELKSMC